MRQFDFTLYVYAPGLLGDLRKTDLLQSRLPRDLVMMIGVQPLYSVACSIPAPSYAEAIDQAVEAAKTSGFGVSLTPEQEGVLHDLANHRLFMAQQEQDPAWRRELRRLRNEERHRAMYAGGVVEAFGSPLEEWEFHARYYPASAIARSEPPPEELISVIPFGSSLHGISPPSAE
ncbi:hypothetical protein KIKIMORA_00060 [Brevundimonas phage vB_BpoS-Kikimora]|uniref:Uncharacterized protein n=1 Tax=Brevundimonas phage vB_BpoS-Kikimora TaxID=2948601 RepID=A0A9E7MR77_9CAUD|nr:hypothetical protein KIKIMORA_00060 [Brevundimonas phage vB_BpoS-Kikimora]